MNHRFSFSSVPTIKRRRSAFDLSHSVKTSINAGYLYPLDVQEVYPGDTFKIQTKAVARVTSAFLKPVMDNAFLEIYHFYVPSRLCFNKWDQVFGYNPNGYWAQQNEVQVPVFASGANDTSQVSTGTVADYLGIPLTGKNNSGGTWQQGYLHNTDVSVLPFRAFALIYDEWFRDQNNEQPMNVIKGDLGVSEVLNGNAWSPSNYCGLPPKVNKFHDLFTSCLPAPQKGNAVELIPSNNEKVLPVGALTLSAGDKSSSNLFPIGSALRTLMDKAGYTTHAFAASMNTPQWSSAIGNQTDFTSDKGVGTVDGFTYGGSISNLDDNVPMYLSNLAAYDKGMNSININELRYAFAIQRMLEIDALGGNRMQEYLLAHFGVYAPDARLQKPEFLGGSRIPLNVQQVAQTSEATSNSPLANLAGYSLTNGEARCTKGFVEAGYVITVGFIRQIHSYQQGLERFWSRKRRVDMFDPVFSNIGEQPTYARELNMYDVGNSNNPDQVFGYNEAWADLRYRPNKITGEMRSQTSRGGSLDIWHFGDYYGNIPSLNASFINETPDYIDRTLAVPSSTTDQFILDIYQHSIAYRELPVYSTPSKLG